MAKDVFVRIRGEDSLSPVLKKVGASAKAAAADMKTAGESAKQSGESAKQASTSFKDYDDEMRNVGLAAGVLVAGLALSGQSFRDQEIGIRNLQRSYGDAADDMRQFAQQIQDTTNFSNDAGVQAANIAATLARNYGFTADEIQRVLQISADLAATSGLGLEDTTYRVVAALRGEAEAAEALGLTMNQAAIDQDNLTLSMGNAEAGHFRLNALYEQSAFAQGAAAEQADTFYGTLTDIAHGAQDAAQAFGGMLGPIGQLGAFASDNALKFAAMGLAIGQLSKGATALNALTTGLTGVNVAARAMTLALGPVGIAAAAVLAVAGLVAMYEAADGMVSSADVAIEHLGDLEQTMRELYAAGSDLGQLAERGATEIFPDITKDIARAEELENAIAQTNRSIGQMTGDDLATAEANLERWGGELLNIAAKYGVLDAATVSAALSQQDVIGAMDDLNAILKYTGVGAAQAQAETAELFDQFDRGEISGATLIKELDTIKGSLSSYDATATAAAAGTAKLTDAQKAYNFQLAKANQTLEDYQQNQQIGGQNLAGEHREAAAAIEAETRAIAEQQAAIDKIKGPSTDAQGAIDLQGAIQGARSAQEGLAQGIRNASDAMTYQVGESERLAAELAKDAAAVEKLGEQYAETFGQMQASATQATDTLDSVFRAIVGNTDAIASQSQAVMDWADGLIGAAGTVGEIDQLLADGAITLDDYTAAQGAYNDIAAANASIQQDVLSIQTQLAPVVAQSTAALAEQMDAIANGSTDAQLFALGMMDAATSSQALALAQGYLADQDVFGPMIQSAAELNPMLAQILEEMGLISYNPATGEVTLEGVEESQSELSMLTDAMTQLDGTLATLNAILNDDASAYITDVSGLIHELDGDTATLYANLVDNASSGIAAAHAALMALDGASATAYITTIQSTIGDPFGVRKDGGMIARANGGSIPFVGAEGTGFELMRRGDGGGLQMLPSPGVYNAPQGSMVFPHGASMSMMDNMGGGSGITINVQGSVYGVDDLTATVAAAVAEGMVISRQRYVRGQAV